MNYLVLLISCIGWTCLIISFLWPLWSILEELKEINKQLKKKEGDKQ